MANLVFFAGAALILFAHMTLVPSRTISPSVFAGRSLDQTAGAGHALENARIALPSVMSPNASHDAK